MSISLLATKLRIPRQRVNGVSRPRLTEKLSAAVDRPGNLVLLSGPAGFGKTTLLSEFAAGRLVAWVSLGEEDSEPVRFWSYVVTALQIVEPDIGKAAMALLETPQELPAESVPTALINDLIQSEQDITLILDDYHAIRNQNIHTALSFFIDHLPDNLHLILSTRMDPPLPLARLRARDRLTEIRVADLRFRQDEIASFLSETMGLELRDRDVKAIEARTEGWIASLQLAAISMRGHTDLPGFIRAFTGSNVFVAEYLMEEVLSQQPEDVGRFLLQTSILARLNPSLCDALRNGSDSQVQLRQLYQSNLFVIPLDDEGYWFRYHQLFADLLKARLQISTSSEEIAALHRRAALWYEQAGMTSDAIFHALQVKDYSYAVALIEKIALPMILKANFKTVEDWLAAIPPEFLKNSLPANLALAWMHLLRRNMERAVPYLERLHQVFLESGEMSSTLQGEWFALQSILLSAQGKAAESRELAERALQLLPGDETQVRSMTYMALSNAYEQMLEYGLARGVLETMIQQARSAGDLTSEVFGSSLLGRMILQQGELHATYQIVSQALQQMENQKAFSPFSATLFGELAQVYYHWHQFAEARDYFARSVQWSTLGGFSDAEIYHSVFLSRLFQMEGDLQSSVREIENAAHLMETAAPALVREEVVAQQVSVFLALDRLTDAQNSLSAYGFTYEEGFSHPALDAGAVLTHANALLYNSALRILLHRSRVKSEQQDLLAGILLAERVIKGSLRCKLLPIALQTILLRAQLHVVAGNDSAGLADVVTALKWAEPQGFISLFVEEGSAISNLLALLLRQKPVEPAPASYIERIFAALPDKQSFQTEPSIVDIDDDLRLIQPLTRREREVLHHIAAGDSNQMIADKLVITLSAVKKHTRNIFAKLNVNSRTQAIARARQLKLINSN
jgi:LuxR family transcriptional regulator, maltose regulon positive regulatory protein